MLFDLQNKTFDWVESTERHLGILVNSCFESDACLSLIDDKVVNTILIGLKICSLDSHKLVQI